MQKTIQLILLICVSNVIIPRVNAQLPKVLAFGNITYASPVGEFKNIANNGIGYEIGAGLGLGKTMLMASSGNIRYTLPNLGHLSVTPWKFGVRQYLLLGLFLNGNVGVARLNYDYNSLPDEQKSNFLYEVGAGYKLGFFELGAAYTGFGENRNALLLKGGLAIKL
ncbi:hypothetical protein [Sediminibacterium soli]|uniref:hypothetical protein n=1 Tax=Sediminibacterium soli TaxID=2698829 RepID=UPI00137AC3D8|nr:hypothetical protein [Sediminibacterium soli]NCI47000.1 hypothetical protein [Sediminibacterium soli]